MAIQMPQQKQNMLKGILPMAGKIIGSYFGPVGGAVGGVIGTAAGRSGSEQAPQGGLAGAQASAMQQQPSKMDIGDVAGAAQSIAGAKSQQSASIPSDKEAMRMSLNNRMSSMRDQNPDIQILEAQQAMSKLPAEQRAEYEPYFNQYAELKRRERVRGF